MTANWASTHGADPDSSEYHTAKFAVETVLDIASLFIGAGEAKMGASVATRSAQQVEHVVSESALAQLDDWATVSGILRDAAKGKGNFGLGSGTMAQAEAAGRAWVGDAARLSGDGKAWVSRDGLPPVAAA